MFAQFRIQMLLGLFAAATFGGSAAAQVGLTPPKAGGAAGPLLKDIYAQDVGYGYSVQSLNQIALTNARNQVNYYSGTTNTRPRGPAGFSAAPALPKPFTGYTPEPTVSPYLNLFREDIEGGGDLNYQTLVRPILQQQQFNQQVQRQSMELSRRLQAMAAQSDFNPQGSKSQYPTGHATVFMYYGHYYPSANVRPRR